ADLLYGTTKVDVAQVCGHHCDTDLVGAMDFARAGGRDHVGHGFQRDRATVAGIDDQVADALHGRTVGLARAHQHVDLPIAEAVTRGDVAVDLVDDDIGDLAGRHAKGSGALLVETDLYFGKALLDRRLDVSVVGVAAQQRGHALAGAFDRVEVLSRDFDF